MSLTVDIQIANHVVAFPGVGSRLLAGAAERESLESYQRAGGYQPIEDPERLLEAPVWEELRRLRSVPDADARPQVLDLLDAAGLTGPHGPATQDYRDSLRAAPASALR